MGSRVAMRRAPATTRDSGQMVCLTMSRMAYFLGGVTVSAGMVVWRTGPKAKARDVSAGENGNTVRQSCESSSGNTEAAPATVSGELRPHMPLTAPVWSGREGRDEVSEPRARRPAGTSRPSSVRGARWSVGTQRRLLCCATGDGGTQAGSPRVGFIRPARYRPTTCTHTVRP